MKLYKAEYDDGSVVSFMGEPLVCNNPYLFEYLIQIENEKIDKFNYTTEKAERFFNKPMPRSVRQKMEKPNIIEFEV